MKQLLVITVLSLALVSCAKKSEPEQHAQASYFDHTGRDDVSSGGVKMIAINTPKGHLPRLDQARRQQSAHQGPPAARRPRRHARILRGVRQLSPRRRHRVLLLRPTRLRITATSPTTRRCGTLPRFVEEVEQVRQALGLDKDNFYLLGPLVGRHSRHRVRAQVPAAPEGPHHLQHDVEHPGLQRVREERAHAGDGPERAGGDPAHRGRRGTTRTRATWSC